jgi:pimeloyl-ACP methyl ester carboxylesterase
VFDNRDVGRSTWFDHVELDPMVEFAKAFGGETPASAYGLSDMAADVVGLLDGLGIDRAHVAGLSMGGMIAQLVAIEHPHRVLSLTSVMSTSGEDGVGAPTADAGDVLVEPAPSDRAGYIDHCTAGSRVYASPDFWNEAAVRALHAREYDRAFHPEGAGRHLLAVLASGSRAEGLRALDVPAAVVHGLVDPLVRIDGGRRTAELIPGAELVEVPEMGHDLPCEVWGTVADVLVSVAERARASAATH